MLPIRTILYATDLSDSSDHAFRRACAIARVFGARLIVLHVCSPANFNVEFPVALIESPEDAKQLEATLQQRYAVNSDLRAEFRTEEGAAAATILRVARETKADLIVLGTHGRTGLGRLLIGSVAEQVIREAQCPVLAIRGTIPDKGLAVSAILHPTDFSEHSALAFRLACSLAHDAGARLIAMHVRTPAKVDLYGGTPVVEQLEAHDAQEQAKLRRLKSRHTETIVEHRLEKGLPAEEILRVAGETECGLIVMGTHGRSGLGRLLMGSVAERVLRKASCPVLLVKSPLTEAKPVSKTASDRTSPQ